LEEDYYNNQTKLDDQINLDTQEVKNLESELKKIELEKDQKRKEKYTSITSLVVKTLFIEHKAENGSSYEVFGERDEFLIVFTSATTKTNFTIVNNALTIHANLNKEPYKNWAQSRIKIIKKSS